MKINKFFLVLSFLFFSLSLTGCGNNKVGETTPTDQNAEIIFFYGQECPHCKSVEKYITDNNIEEKVNFIQSEVYHNNDNAKLMVEKQKECSLDEKMIGAVPFLWTQEKCFIGQDEIIQFFKGKINGGK